MIFNFQHNVSAETKATRQKIAVYMGRGFSQKEIGDILGISQAAVSNHEKAIRKFGGEFAYMLARKNGMAQLMFDSIVGFQGVIHDLELMKAETYEIEDTEHHTITRRPVLGGNAMVASCRVQMECYEKIYQMAKEGPFVIGGKRVQQELDVIKRSARSGKEIDIHGVVNGNGVVK